MRTSSRNADSLPAAASAPATVDTPRSEPDNARALPLRGRQRLLLACAVAVTSVLVFYGVHDSLIDDAYITLDYARNLAFHFHWGLVPDLTSNTATSPLNVIVIAAASAVLRHPVLALGVVFVIANVVTALALVRAARVSGLPGFSGLAGYALLLFNPLLLSTVGMELTLAETVIALALVAAVRHRAVAFGVLAGLLVLTRVDLVVFAVLLLLGCRGIRRQWWQACVAAVVVALPWFAFSWTVLGSAIPDTFVIKTSQDSWGIYQFGNGALFYFDVYPVATALSALPVLLGTAALVVWIVTRIARPEAARGLDVFAVLAVSGLAYYGVYSALGVPPYHWYYGPTVIALGVFAAMAAGRVARFVAPAGPLPKLGAVAGTAVVGCAALAGMGFGVSRGLPWTVSPITTNWATSADYARIGKNVGRIVGDGSVTSAGELGTIAYFCHCEVIDEFSDPGRTRALVTKKIEDDSGIGKALLEADYTHADRSVTPVRADFRLTYAPGPPGGHGWPTSSPWTGPGHMTVLPR